MVAIYHGTNEGAARSIVDDGVLPLSLAFCTSGRGTFHALVDDGAADVDPLQIASVFAFERTAFDQRPIVVKCDVEWSVVDALLRAQRAKLRRNCGWMLGTELLVLPEGMPSFNAASRRTIVEPQPGLLALPLNPEPDEMIGPADAFPPPLSMAAFWHAFAPKDLVADRNADRQIVQWILRFVSKNPDTSSLVASAQKAVDRIRRRIKVVAKQLRLTASNDRLAERTPLLRIFPVEADRFVFEFEWPSRGLQFFPVMVPTIGAVFFAVNQWCPIAEIQGIPAEYWTCLERPWLQPSRGRAPRLHVK